MLKRMWSGDLTKEDRMRINLRVLGSSGVELPPDFEDKEQIHPHQYQTDINKQLK